MKCPHFKEVVELNVWIVNYILPLERMWLLIHALLPYIFVQKVSCGPFYKHGLTLIPAWISNYTHYNLWDEIAPLKFRNG